MNILLNIIIIYTTQMLICTIIHIINATRVPTSIFDFLKLTFLPYVIFTPLNKLR